MQFNKVYLGDCNDLLKQIESDCINLIYFDPPFFTQKKHSLSDYLSIIEATLFECKRVLKNTGNVFLHCDRNRLVLQTFGRDDL
ncbi:DNA methyltransferase [Leptospira idonii]|uniref:DNA methyltransferase n=1 Tax=Leptospira idonii TaxID=1193500 RepID=UPI001AEFDF94|nr:DNA methyltransferase [Leptospira idonii]